MTPDDLIAAFNELDDAETRIDRTKAGDADTVRLVPSWNKAAVRRFKALAVDAAGLFDPAGHGNPETRWLRFVLDHAPELVEDRHAHGPASLGYAIEHDDDGTERRVPFIAQTLPNAASASALVVRRCRPLIEQGERIERAQAGMADALARADVDTSTLPVDAKASTRGTKPRRRPRSDADKARDEGEIAGHLAEHPDATRDELAKATGISAGHVSESKAWKAHRTRRSEARNANRARGIGGMGDE